ncbi:MAG: peptidylprolyl isomerase [Pyrinomonadaceae bacterium]|nr:peptidylprolyl isomerase [Pyrinomonadaceae bacterium]
MSKKSLAIVLVLFAAVCAGFFIWRVQNIGAKNEKMEAEILKGLTAEEISLVLKSGDSETGGIAENAETRAAFLKGLREYLALAAQARRANLTEDANFKINLEYKQNILLADLYNAKLSGEQGKFYVVPKEETEVVWSKPENEKQFEIDMDTLRAIQTAVAKERGDGQTFPKLQGGSLIKARENWARVKILSDRAKADAEFLQKREVSLRLKIVEAGILSADYLRKNWAQNIKATAPEIAEYLAAHPEYDVKKKRERAETILRQVQLGADFGKLAAEFSEDRATKSKGGLYENVGKDVLWAEVENAALGLENGNIANQIIETQTGFHVVKLENKQINKDSNGGESIKFSIRHILLQKNFEEPGNRYPDVPAPFVKAEEIAKAEVEKQKRSKFVEAVINRSQIILPEDFTVEPPKSVAVNP